MKCPKCNVTLLLTERQGVEIDYCPECRGVWLDRGELDKIIERMAGEQPSAHQAQPAPGGAPNAERAMPPGFGQHQQYPQYPQQGQHGWQHHDKHGNKSGHGYKRHSFFGELFDF